MDTRQTILRRRQFHLIGMLVAALTLTSCSSGAQIKALPIGGAAPTFSLKDFTGQEHSLVSLKGKIVVLDFSSMECPYSRGADLSWVDLANQYGPKGVVFLGIDSHKSTTTDQLKQYAADNKIPFPILKDVNNTYADAIGATRTPEVFILDKDQKIAYHGAFDDRKVPEKAGDTPYVRNALDDLLAGKPVRTPEMEAWGCTIKRAK